MSCRSAILALAGLLIVAMAPACSTVQVHSDSAPGTDFSAYKTFTQVPPPRSAGKSLPGYSMITGEHIQSSIAHELEAKGLTRARANKADLIVAFSIDGQPRQDVEWDGGYGGWYGGGYGGGAYAVNYVAGTLTIDMFDAKKKKLVWHAYGQTDLYGSNQGGDKIDKAVSEILKRYTMDSEAK